MKNERDFLTVRSFFSIGAAALSSFRAATSSFRATTSSFRAAISSFRATTSSFRAAISSFRAKRRNLKRIAFLPLLLLALGAPTAANAQDAANPATNNEQRTTNNALSFNMPRQNLAAALNEFSVVTEREIVFDPSLVVGLEAPPLQGDFTPEQAIERLLTGTGLQYRPMASGAYAVVDPNAAALAGENTVGQRRPGIEEIIVTGQKREERIQDVPIAISAFTQEDLTTQQIAGGPDLITQVPNFAFTKTNFTGYSIQIRGIGTQAISATTDPAVAVALNNTPFIRNRFFEQEFYDMERVEILRGPQGTLYGRNATAGVVNLITAKPKFQEESMLSVDKGNFDSRRLEGMINVPLIEDKVAFRLAGAWTKRDGYAINEITDNPIDGRDLWSTRASLRIAPSDRVDINLIWEHFEENDDRLRSGKQLCKTDEVTEVAGLPTTHFQTLPNTGQEGLFAGIQARFSQGCTRNSLYAEDSFQTPNGLMLPYYKPLEVINLPGNPDPNFDPYERRVQSRDLRVIESTVDPDYRARSDIGELQVSVRLTDGLTLESETGYNSDEIFSQQDFNRFNTAPGAWHQPGHTPTNFNNRPGVLQEGPNGGIFCDPQIGCSDRLVAVDVSTAESEQFSQEFRLASDFDGPFNFSLGANFLRYDTEDKYYVFVNSLTLISLASDKNDDLPYVPSETTNEPCLRDGLQEGFFEGGRYGAIDGCVYVDPNPIGSLNDLGHNYFLSKNPFNLESYAVFGETYWNITDALKLTAGLRWSVDRKTAPLHPTWLFVPESVGFPVEETIEQTWREPTGRLVLDWKPQLGFTDETLVYGSIARGYKAGGANPPRFIGVGPSAESFGGITASETRPRTFDAEFVNALELGTKNTLLDGAMTVNLAAFYYDYKGYQISEIVDRSAFNRNFDVDVWGGEIETDWWLRENIRLSFKGGYTNTRIADGESAVDLLDRAAGGKHFFITDARNPDFDSSQEIPESEYVAGLTWDDIPDGQEFFAYDDWVVYRPFPIFPSSCVMPAYVLRRPNDAGEPELVDVGAGGGAAVTGCELAYFAQFDPAAEDPYEPNPQGSFFGRNPDFGSTGEILYPGFDPSTAPNNGEGFSKDLGGNELPNAPNYTATISGDYIVPLSPSWTLTWHTDLHWQSESWWRVFNDHEHNRLDDYFTMNLAAILEGGDGWHIMAYIKNVTDETAITGGFLNSDDTGLTTNVFLTEPRLYGIRATKRWGAGSGGPSHWVRQGGAALFGKEPGEPSPWELTLGGYLLRPHDAPLETVQPAFISEFDPDIDPTGLQHEDLDWGDGREIVLTYAPDNGWRFSLGARLGESRLNRTDGERLVLRGEVIENCLFNNSYGLAENGVPCSQENDFGVIVDARYPRSNYGLGELTESEEHLLIDFTIGRDVGLGGFLDGTLSAGLRYAQFKSRTDGVVRGTPDWDIPEECWFGEIAPGCGKYSVPATRHEYFASMDAEREFEGLGLTLGWEASNRLLGDDNAGHLDLDWSLSGGVLFGKQKTSAEGVVEGQYFVQTLPENRQEGDRFPDSSYSTPFSFERDDDVTVPTIGAELGLTYRIGGASIGAGYQWERYYGVIDGGIEEHKEFDRTLDGPYLKITFGGGS